MTWNWSVLGVHPLLGRVFTEEEDEKGVRVAVLSYGLWQRRFGGSADVVGRSISLNDEPYEVIGVLPKAFYFLPSRDIEVWMPASFPPWMRRNFTWHDANIVARLKPGITLDHARKSMAALSLEVTAKDFRGPHPVEIYPLRDEMTGKMQMALVVLLCAAGALLLIACVNLANLLEALVPDAMGAARLSLDWRVLAVAASAAISAAVILGIAPALRSSRATPQESLRDGSRGSAGARSHWFQHALIVLETSLAVILLTCGGLLLQTFEHLRNADLGLRSAKLLTFETPLFRYKDFDRRVAFLNAEVEKVRAVPGVVGAGSINLIPFTNQASATFYRLEGQPGEVVATQVALIRNVSRDYFSTVGAQLREGRSFSPADQRSDSPVAVVNQVFADRHFTGRSPLGQRFKFGSLGSKGYWYTIVGVVKPMRESGVLEEVKPSCIVCTSNTTRSATSTRVS